MPTQRFHAASTATSDPESAWKSMQDVDTWEGIAGVDRVSHPHHDVDGRLTGFRIEATVGGMLHPGTATVEAATMGESMRISLTTRDLEGLIDVTLRADGSGSTVDVDLSIRSRSLTASLFFPTVAGAIGRGMQAMVEDFAARL